MRDHYDDPLSWDEKRQFLEEAILNHQSMRYGLRNEFTITPFDSNDLADKVHEFSGQLLTAYINDDDQALLKIIKSLCYKEMDSLHDLIYN